MFASLLLCYQLPQPKPVQLACATAKNNETVDVFHTGSEGIDVVFLSTFWNMLPLLTCPNSNLGFHGSAGEKVKVNKLDSFFV